MPIINVVRHLGYQLDRNIIDKNKGKLILRKLLKNCDMQLYGGLITILQISIQFHLPITKRSENQLQNNNSEITEQFIWRQNMEYLLRLLLDDKVCIINCLGG